MQSGFRVFVDGSLILEPDGSTNEPEGLLESELKLIRDEATRGIFLEYITPVTFRGAAYQYIKSINDTNDDCAKIGIKVDFACNNGYETLFDGQIPIGSDQVEWNEWDCSVTTRLENADFSNFLKTFGNFKVRINQQNCLDGVTPLPSVVPSAVVPFNGFLGGSSSVSALSYLYIDILQHVLTYLSNGEITLVADAWYSTQFVPQQIVLNLADNTGVPAIDFVNFFGQERSATSPAGEISNFGAALLHKANPNSPAYEDRNNIFEKSSHVSFTGSALSISNYLPWQSWNFTYAPGFTVFEVPFQYGLKNLAITTNTALQGQNVPISVTLNQLLKHACDFSNMGYRMARSGSGYNFFLQRVESLFDLSNAVKLQDVRGIKYKSSGLFNVTAITTPEGKADELFKNNSYNTGNCYGDNLDIEGKNFSSQEIFDYLVNTQKQDDDLVFMFLNDTDHTQAQKWAFKFQVNGLGGPAYSDEYYHYNAPYFQPLIAQRYNINTGDRTFKTEIPLQSGDFSTCVNCPAAEIKNDVDIGIADLKRLYEFESPLSFSQIKELRDNQLQTVEFTDNQGVDKAGFIKDISIKLKDFLGTFAIYSSSK